MNVKNKSLIVFSENYPYEGGEQFFVNDLYYLSGKFSKLYVFPTKEKNKQIIEKELDKQVAAIYQRIPEIITGLDDDSSLDIVHAV